MCLYVDWVKTKRFKATKRKTNYVWYWKLLVKTERNKLVSPYYSNKHYNPGFVKSNRQSIKIKDYKVHRGIHVYTNKERAYPLLDSGSRLVKVKCLVKDHVAHGIDDAVFTKVYLPKSEYLRAIK